MAIYEPRVLVRVNNKTNRKSWLFHLCPEGQHPENAKTEIFALDETGRLSDEDGEFMGNFIARERQVAVWCETKDDLIRVIERFAPAEIGGTL
jgi:hypothetical protein